jgi:hypothetical protein
MCETYKIVRMYFDREHWPSRTIKTGLTLEQAQVHCGDPETSSSTCTGSAGKRRTYERGAWFDAYEEE